MVKLLHKPMFPLFVFGLTIKNRPESENLIKCLKLEEISLKANVLYEF